MESVSNDAVSSSQLSLQEMAGTFVIHLIATGVAIIVGIVMFYKKSPRNDSINATETISNKSNGSGNATKTTSNRWSDSENATAASLEQDQEQLAARPGQDRILSDVQSQLSDVQSQLAEMRDFLKAQAYKQDDIAAKQEELARSREDFYKKQDKVLADLSPKSPLSKKMDPHLLRVRVNRRITADLGEIQRLDKSVMEC
jgi:hypothetical protein